MKVQFASCLGEELGIAGNRKENINGTTTTTTTTSTREKTLLRHQLLLTSTGIELSWVGSLASKLLEDVRREKKKFHRIISSILFHLSFF